MNELEKGHITLEDRCTPLRLYDKDGDYILVCLYDNRSCPYSYTYINSHTKQPVQTYCMSISKNLEAK